MPSRHIAANAASFAYRAKQNHVLTFSFVSVSVQLHCHRNFQKTHYPQNMCTKRECESEYNELLERIKKQRGSIIEYIANTAENSFRVDKVLIIS